MKSIIFTILTLNVCVKLFAQCDACNKALEKDQVLNYSTIYQTIDYLEKISESDYYRLTKDAEISAKVFVFGGHTNYKEFQERLRTYKREVGYTEQFASTNQYSTYTTNPISYKYWAECMKSCSAVPFVAWLDKEDEGAVIVGMKFNYDGEGPSTLRVKIQVTQNGKKTSEFVTINPGYAIPTVISRLYDTEGKSRIEILIQPVNSKGQPRLQGYPFVSKYFDPLIVFDGVSYEYADVVKDIVYATGTLSAGDFEEKHCSDVGYRKWCQASPVLRSCDKKYAAKPCVAILHPKEGYYFVEPSNKSLITFRAVAGAGAGWNQNNLCDDNKLFTIATPNHIEIAFMGSASKATTWEVTREAQMDVRPSIPLLFYYQSRSTLAFSVPLSKQKDFTIRLRTPSNGVFTIDANNLSKFRYGDADGYRHFQIDMKELKDPAKLFEFNNMEQLQKAAKPGLFNN